MLSIALVETQAHVLVRRVGNAGDVAQVRQEPALGLESLTLWPTCGPLVAAPRPRSTTLKAVPLRRELVGYAGADGFDGLPAAAFGR
jgi:hypothetical protein